MQKIKLTRYEKAIEEASMRGEYRNATPEEFEQIASAITAWRKKNKAKRMKKRHHR